MAAVVGKPNGAFLGVMSGPPAISSGSCLGESPPQIRPAKMSAWPDLFVPQLITAMREAQPASSLPTELQTLRGTATPAPGPTQTVLPVAAQPQPDLSDQLSKLRSASDWQELLLTALALLEAELRGSEALQVGATVVPTSGGRMSRLRDYFGPDLDPILAGVRLRHDLLQNLEVDSNQLATHTRNLEEIVRRRRNLPPR